MKIVSALMLVAMMFMIYPSVKNASKNSSKADKGDWISVIKPLVFVVGFIIVLIMLVQ